jgi:hypothetical protein
LPSNVNDQTTIAEGLVAHLQTQGLSGLPVCLKLITEPHSLPWFQILLLIATSKHPMERLLDAWRGWMEHRASLLPVEESKQTEDDDDKVEEILYMAQQHYAVYTQTAAGRPNSADVRNIMRSWAPAFSRSREDMAHMLQGWRQFLLTEQSERPWILDTLSFSDIEALQAQWAAQPPVSDSDLLLQAREFLASHVIPLVLSSS